MDRYNTVMQVDLVDVYHHIHTPDSRLAWAPATSAPKPTTSDSDRLAYPDKMLSNILGLCMLQVWYIIMGRAVTEEASHDSFTGTDGGGFA